MELMQWLYDIDDTGYRASLSILWQGFVRPTDLPRCVGKDVAGLEGAHRSACFSESPLDELAQLIRTRSLYGVGFCQDFLRLIAVSRSGTFSMAAPRPSGGLRKSAGVALVDTEDPLWQKYAFRRRTRP